MKIIKIGASWCSGCAVMRPRWDKIEKMRKEIGKPIETEYFDYDIHEDELKEKYNTGDKLPIFIFLDKNGNELERQIGEPSEELLLSLIDKYEAL